MKKKIFLLLIIMILLSGCSVNSNVTMDAYGKVKEEVTVSGNADNFSYDDEIVNNAIDSYLNKYKSVLDFRGYESSKKIENNIASGTLTKSYDNICSYFQDTAFNQYVFKHINCTETDEYYEIANDTNYIPYCEDCSDWPTLDDVNLVLKLPVKDLETNADSVNKNTYTWHFDSNTPSDKSIYIKINKELLKKKENNKKIQDKIFGGAKITGIILLVVCVIVFFVFIGNSLYKKYKSNKLDY